MWLYKMFIIRKKNNKKKKKTQYLWQIPFASIVYGVPARLYWTHTPLSKAQNCPGKAPALHTLPQKTVL